MSLELLSWDTNFFKKNVYKLNSSSFSEIQLQLKNASKGSLIYIFSDLEIPELATKKMDTKIIFSRSQSARDASAYSPDCFNFDSENMSFDALEKLALDSSQYSRFRVDPDIDQSLADQLYRLWIKKAVEDKKSHQVIVKMNSQNIAGMIALQFLPQLLKIELIAVSQMYRGQGIGQDLINCCFAFAREKDIVEVQVTTQGDNKVACSLYEKKGFSVIEQKYIYHIHL